MLEHEIQQRIAKNIKSERIKLNMSLKQLAILAECSEPTISRVENGDRMPSLFLTIKIMKVLNLNFYELIKKRMI